MQHMRTKQAGLFDRLNEIFTPKAKDVVFGPGKEDADSDAQARIQKVVTRIRSRRTNVPTSESTALPRHSVPVAELSEESLKNLGFVPSYVAVPERGQSRVKTYRHPYNNVHVHKHTDDWLLHEDNWPALSSMMRKRKLEAARGVGLPKLQGSDVSAAAKHGIMEGIPGWLSYLRGSILGEPSFAVAGRDARGDSAVGQLGRGIGASTLAGVAANALSKREGAGVSTAATVAGALGGSKAMSALHDELVRRKLVSNAPTLLSTALQIGGPIAGGLAGYRLTRALRKPKAVEEEGEEELAHVAGLGAKEAALPINKTHLPTVRNMIAAQFKGLRKDRFGKPNRIGRWMATELRNNPEAIPISVLGAMIPVPVPTGTATAGTYIGVKKLVKNLGSRFGKQGAARQDGVTLNFVAPEGTVKAAVFAEIADTPELRRKGLSKRAELPAGSGMFFDKVGAYWMKDVNFDLDIVFLDKQGTVLEKQYMPKLAADDAERPLYVPQHAEAAHALELPVGWFDQHQLAPGDRLLPAA